MPILTLHLLTRSRPCLGLLWLLTSQAAQAQITLTPASQLVLSENSVFLEFPVKYKHKYNLIWTVETPVGAPGTGGPQPLAPQAVTPSTGGAMAQFIAPEVARLTPFRVRVTDANNPGDTAEATVLVMPKVINPPRPPQPAAACSSAAASVNAAGPEASNEVGELAMRNMVETFLPHFMNDASWPVAQATLFAHLDPEVEASAEGEPPATFGAAASPAASAAAASAAGPRVAPPVAVGFLDQLLTDLGQQRRAPWQVDCLQRLEGDPAMADLNDKWLVGHARGLMAVDARGRLAQNLPVPPASVRALAIRPRDSAPGNPLHVVFAQLMAAQLGLQARAVVQDQLWRMGPGGALEVYSGNSPADPGSSPWKDGPAAQAQFGRIVALAMDRAGIVYVADPDNGLIRRVALDGSVTTLAGKPPNAKRLRRTLFPVARGGSGLDAQFCRLRGLTLDPASGDLYATDGDCVRRITQAGLVSTILGDYANAGFEPANPDQPVPPGEPCLKEPAALQFYRGKLFILDEGNRALRVFHLGTRKLQTVLGDPSQREFRLGPIRRFAPHLPLEVCAALPKASALAITPGGTCMVGSEQNLVQLYLATLVEHAQPAAGSK